MKNGEGFERENVMVLVGTWTPTVTFSIFVHILFINPEKVNIFFI